MEYNELILLANGFLVGYVLAAICESLDQVIYYLKILGEEKERLHIDNRLKNRLNRKIKAQPIDKSQEKC